MPVYGYHAWWRDGRCDRDVRLPPPRREAARSRERPPHLWLFKAPHHNFHLEAILAAYPDARFVMTHRDPVKAVPSWASLVSTIFPDTQRRASICTGSAARCRTTCASVSSRPSRRGRASARIASSTCTTASSSPTRWARCGSVYDFLGYELTPDGRADDRRLAGRQPVRRAGHAPLHGGAVRVERRAAPRRLRLLHPTTSTSPSRGHHDRSTSPRRPPHLGRPDARARGASATTSSTRGAPTAPPRPRCRT